MSCAVRRAVGVALLLALGASPACWAGDKEPPEEQDWPTLITRLQQDVYQRPGSSAQRQLAVAYNNYGVSLGNTKQWSLATQQLEEALRLDADNLQFRRNLSNIYMNQALDAHQQHRPDEALRLVEKALAHQPTLPQAFVLRGEVEYGRQRLKEAKAAWTRALELDPQLPDVKERLERVTQELPVESKFERLSQAYFDLRYEEHLERPVGFDVRDALLEARRLVGSDFAYWPKRKLVVLIYSAEKFRALRQETPDWVGGQFDGKIRVPLPSAALNQAAVKQILFHEYTHAIVFDLTAGKCPTWLNEGLAEYEGRTQLPGSLAYLIQAHQSGRLIPWRELSDFFAMSLPADTVGLAYQEAYSIVAHLVTRFGFWRIRRVLKSIAGGQPWDQALSAEYRQKPDRLETQWRTWLPELLAQPSPS